MAHPDLQTAIDAALADAAKRTGIDRAQLVVLSAHAVTWPDGSLGCPRPGRSYTQALVPGFRVQVQAHAALLDYHASARNPSRPALCPAASSRPPYPAPHI